MTARTAFIHVDLDDLWAIADCYGFDAPTGFEHFVYTDAIPRFAEMFSRMGVQATFFVVGRDIEWSAGQELLRELVQKNHALANHSYNHPLNFRNLAESEIEAEIAKTETLLAERLNVRPRGFRAPGYGVSPTLLRVLARRGYAYDSSIMPGPYGFVFRWLDGRLRKTTERGSSIRKTQFSQLGDTFAPISPYPVSVSVPTQLDKTSALLEIPAATSPLLRLPFQAGVCMRMGKKYFDAQLAAFLRQPGLPLLFLLHGADLTDFSKVGHPFFKSRFFLTPIAEKVEAVRYFLERITGSHSISLTEDWIRTAL